AELDAACTQKKRKREKKKSEDGSRMLLTAQLFYCLTSKHTQRRSLFTHCVCVRVCLCVRVCVCVMIFLSQLRCWIVSSGGITCPCITEHRSDSKIGRAS